MADSSPSISLQDVYPGREGQALHSVHEATPETLGIIGMLEFQKTLARLTEPYVAPAERDYRTY